MTLAVLRKDSIPLILRAGKNLRHDLRCGLLHVFARRSSRQRREAKLIAQEQPARGTNRGEV
jgi:hypothetical protein